GPDLPAAGDARLRLRPDLHRRRLGPDLRRDGARGQGRGQPPRRRLRQAEGSAVLSAAPPPAVYLPWPYCSRVWPYCDFAVVRGRGRKDGQAARVGALAADLGAPAALMGPRRLTSVYLGGGTPSLMDPRAAGRLVALARRLWPAGPDLEVTLEANPT